MKENLQKKKRHEKFSCDQYWLIHFTEELHGSVLGNYRIVIKAMSGALAKQMLIVKINDEDDNIALKSVLVYYIHKGFNKISGVKRGEIINLWDHVRRVAFPNEFIKLFKLKKSASYKYGFPMGRGSEQKTSPEVKKARVLRLKKAAAKKRGKSLPKSPLAIRKYGPKTFVSLEDPDFRKMEISYFRKIMKENGGNKTYCAESLGLCAPSFKYYLSKFPEVDWDKEYPLTYMKPKRQNTEAIILGRKKATQTLKSRGHKYFDFKNPNEANNKSMANKRKTWKKNKIDRINKLKDDFLRVFRENNFHQGKTGEVFEKSVDWVRDMIKGISEIDPAFKKEFKEKKQSKRLENTLKTREENRLKYLKSIKNELFEAFYQNGEIYSQAAEYLNMNPSTFGELFKEIQEKGV